MLKFRMWLSAELIGWGVQILPDGPTKDWMLIGLQVALEGLQGGLTSGNEE